MNTISKNIKLLRKINNLTQEEFADKINITRSQVGSYEEGRAEPRLSTISKIAKYFSVKIESLLNVDFENYLNDDKNFNIHDVDVEGKNMRILAIAVDNDNNEAITLVSEKARAGYLSGYSDPEYISELPKFNLPVVEISSNKTYRAFQIYGDSMLPIESGTYIISEYIDNWYDIQTDKTYVLITKDGMVYKRVIERINEQGELTLKSDNPEYTTYKININDVFEIWKAKGYLSFNLPSWINFYSA